MKVTSAGREGGRRVGSRSPVTGLREINTFWLRRLTVDYRGSPIGTPLMGGVIAHVGGLGVGREGALAGCPEGLEVEVAVGDLFVDP